jgi:hypothetical protein
VLMRVQACLICSKFEPLWASRRAKRKMISAVFTAAYCRQG